MLAFFCILSKGHYLSFLSLLWDRQYTQSKGDLDIWVIGWIEEVYITIIGNGINDSKNEWE